MVKCVAKTVDEILSGLEQPRKETTEKIRSMVKSAIPDATEIVRRGRITYVLNGKDLLSVRPTSLMLTYSLFAEQPVGHAF